MNSFGYLNMGQNSRGHSMIPNDSNAGAGSPFPRQPPSVPVENLRSSVTVQELVSVPEALYEWASSHEFLSTLFKIKSQLEQLEQGCTLEALPSKDDSNKTIVTQILVEAPSDEQAVLARKLLNFYFRNQITLMQSKERVGMLQSQLYTAQGDMAAGSVVEFQVKAELLGLIIGTKGKRINRIKEECDVKAINVNDEGRILIFGKDHRSALEARSKLEIVENIVDLNDEQAEIILNDLPALNEIKNSVDLHAANFDRHSRTLTLIGTASSMKSAKVLLEHQLEFGKLQLHFRGAEREVRTQLREFSKKTGFRSGDLGGGDARDGRYPDRRRGAPVTPHRRADAKSALDRSGKKAAKQEAFEGKTASEKKPAASDANKKNYSSSKEEPVEKDQVALRFAEMTMKDRPKRGASTKGRESDSRQALEKNASKQKPTNQKSSTGAAAAAAAPARAAASSTTGAAAAAAQDPTKTRRGKKGTSAPPSLPQAPVAKKEKKNNLPPPPPPPPAARPKREKVKKAGGDGEADSGKVASAPSESNPKKKEKMNEKKNKREKKTPTAPAPKGADTPADQGSGEAGPTDAQAKSKKKANTSTKKGKKTPGGTSHEGSNGTPTIGSSGSEITATTPLIQSATDEAPLEKRVRKKRTNNNNGENNKSGDRKGGSQGGDDTDAPTPSKAQVNSGSDAGIEKEGGAVVA